MKRCTCVGLRGRSAAGVLGLVLTAAFAMQPHLSSAHTAPFNPLPEDELAQGRRGSPPPDAKALYKQHCQACHLDGDSPIDELNFANGKWKHGSRLIDIANVVRDGAPGTAMLGFGEKLPEKEIRALAEYVRTFDKSLKPEQPKKSAKPRDANQP